MILQHYLAVVCLAQSGKKQENDGKTDPPKSKPLKLPPGSPKENPFADPEYYFDMERAKREEYEKNSNERSVHMLSETVPIVFNDDHEFETDWDSGNATTADQCTYTDDGSIMVDTEHWYQSGAFCHEYWECEDPNHTMFIKYHRVQLDNWTPRNSFNPTASDVHQCVYDWARFGWEVDGEVFSETICIDQSLENQDLSEQQKSYRSTGSNKLVFDFRSDIWVTKWGVQAQIKCMDAEEINECDAGTHDCEENAECVPTSNSSYVCKCPTGKWGEDDIVANGEGTSTSPCYWRTPISQWTRMYPIKFNGRDTFAILKTSFNTFERALLSCSYYGMSLPVPTSDEDNDVLSKLLLEKGRYPRAYLAASNSNEERIWTNIYTGEPIDYTKWSLNQPDDIAGKEYVAEMLSSNGDWNDVTLTDYNLRTLICIKDIIDTPNSDGYAGPEWYGETGKFICDNNLSRCHETAVCSTKVERAWDLYSCKCPALVLNGASHDPVSETPTNQGFGQCQYVINGVTAQYFKYKGKQRLFHQTYRKEGFEGALQYCSSIGMHLPVPLSMEELQDLEAIPRYGNTYKYFIGFYRKEDGTWTNIYTDEEMTYNDHWAPGYGPNDSTGWKGTYGLIMQHVKNMIFSSPKFTTSFSTVCIQTDLEPTLDFCGNNFDDCSPDAQCVNDGRGSYKCVCPQKQIGDWLVDATPDSTGRKPNYYTTDDQCFYDHPNAPGHRIYNYQWPDGRNTAVYSPNNVGNVVANVKKCASLGMKLLTPTSPEESGIVHAMRLKVAPQMYSFFKVRIGYARASDGVWRNIYTGEEITWSNFCDESVDWRCALDWGSPITDDYGMVNNFATAYSYRSKDTWYTLSFGGNEYRQRTFCVSPEEGEATEVPDYCAVGLHDCHRGATCFNKPDGSGYSCECQPQKFGDVTVEPTNEGGEGKNCLYSIPGHEGQGKPFYPVTIQKNDGSQTTYAFHTAVESHNLRDAMMYCASLGMHLPIPHNEQENYALQTVAKNQKIYFFYLGISDIYEDMTYTNLYTGDAPEYTNWASGHPKADTKDERYELVAFQKRTGLWESYKHGSAIYWKLPNVRTICQKDAVDTGIFDYCSAGLHSCHVEAECIWPPVDKSKFFECACTDPEFYVGDGIGPEGCVFKHGSKFIIENYNVDLTITDRYVRTQIAMSVENKNTNREEKYEFGVKLDESEFISGLTMRIGDSGAVSVGDVHKEQDAQEIFDNAVAGGLGAAIVSESTTRDTTFATKVSVPAGEKLYIWLNYDKQLTRELAFYKYDTNVFPFDAVDKMSVSVTIDESRNLAGSKTAVYWQSAGRPEGRRAPRNSENRFDLEESAGNKWTYTFEKTEVAAEQWNDQLVVEYDLEREGNTCGDIVIRDGYFIHYIAPRGLSSIPKNVILTVDTSGSMYWRIAQAKQAMKAILDELTDKDTFWLQEFNSWVRVYKQETLQATESNKAAAKAWIDTLVASGGTNLFPALRDGVGRDLDDERANLHFVISDGYPSERWEDIQAGVLEANSIKNAKGKEIGQKWAIYSFGIGYGAPMFELNKLSNWNMGTGRLVVDDADVYAELKSFFNEYSIPLLWNNQFHYAGASEFDCSKKNLYADQELVCIGKLPSDNRCASVSDLDFSFGDSLLADDNMLNENTCQIVDDAGCSSDGNLPAEYDPNDLMANPVPKSPKPDLKKVFAYQQMQRMIGLYHDSYVESVRESLKTDIEMFAIANDFVTEFTALVVVEKDRSRKTVDDVIVKKKRSKEKQQKLKKMFQDYRDNLKRAKEIEKNEMKEERELQKELKQQITDKKPEAETEQKSRGRRSDSFADQSGSFFRLQNLLILLGLFTIGPFRRGIRRVVRNFV